MFLNADGSNRTVSLSDLYDDTCSSSSWLQECIEADRHRAARHNRNELCALLSLSSVSDAGEASSHSAAGAAEDSSGPQPSQGAHARNISSGGQHSGPDLGCKHLSSTQRHQHGPRSSNHVSSPGQQETQRLSTAQQQQQQRQSQLHHDDIPVGQPTAQAAGYSSIYASARGNQQGQAQHACHAGRSAAGQPGLPTAGSQQGIQQPPNRPSAQWTSGTAAALQQTEENLSGLQQAGDLVEPATNAEAAAAAAAAGACGHTSSSTQKDLTERKLVRCLKKLQQDKQRYVLHSRTIAACM